MRNLYPLLLLVLFAPAAVAQTYAVDKGSLVLGGSVSYTSQGGDAYEFDDERTNTLLLNPSVGFFVIPNLAVGADVLYQSTSVGGESFDTFGIGPAVAYYFGGAESTVYPFLGGTVAYTSIDGDASGFGFGAEGGAVFMLSQSVGVRGALYYLTESYDIDGSDDNVSGNTFGLEVGVTAFIF